MSQILLVKTSSLGDVIHALPAVTDAVTARPDLAPDMVVDWLVEDGFAAIPGWHKGVRQVLPVAFRHWRKHPLRGLFTGPFTRFRQRLRRQRYDAVIDAQGLIKSALMAAQSRGPRHGYDWASIREPLATLLYRHRHRVAKQAHAVTRNRALMAKSLGYALPETAPDFGIDRAALPPSPLTRPYITFIHGTHWPAKQWPITAWRALAGHIADMGLDVALHGYGPTETAAAAAIAEGLPHVHVLRDLGLAGVAGLIAHGYGHVGVDTGLTHSSAALNLPGVGLYGPTSPELTGALGRFHVNITGGNPAPPDRHQRRGDTQHIMDMTPDTVATRLAAQCALAKQETP